MEGGTGYCVYFLLRLGYGCGGDCDGDGDRDVGGRGGGGDVDGGVVCFYVNSKVVMLWVSVERGGAGGST